MVLGSLPVPTEMPESEIQRIKDLKCPPPLAPSVANARLRALNSSIQKQASQIEILEKLIKDLESRYKITFTCDSAPVFDLQSVSHPTIDLSGSITNVNLSIHMYNALPGIQGVQGLQGPQGNTGNSNIPGRQGTIGYYGMRGDSVK